MLTDPTIYKSGIHFQFKYQLYHLGLLTTGGTGGKNDVLSNTWRLVIKMVEPYRHLPYPEALSVNCFSSRRYKTGLFRPWN